MDQHIILNVKLIISLSLYIITWDRHLLECLWVCLKRGWTGLECGWDYLICWHIRLNNNKKGKGQLSWAQAFLPVPIFLPSNSWLWIQYGQSPHIPVAMTSLPQWTVCCHTVSQIKLFLSYAAFIGAMKK